MDAKHVEFNFRKSIAIEPGLRKLARILFLLKEGNAYIAGELIVSTENSTVSNSLNSFLKWSL